MREFVGRVAHYSGWLLASNNFRCGFLWVITLGVFVWTVISGFGEPILAHAISERIAQPPESKYDKVVLDIWNFHGLEESIAECSSSSPTRGWGRWIAFSVLFFVSFVYTPIAFREEAREAWEEAGRKIREKEEAEARVTKPEASVTTSSTGETKTGRWRHSFALLFSIDLIAEFVWEFVRGIFKSFTRR